MNIFALHPKPRKAARWHVDKHVVKMLLETCQLLYTAHWVLFYPALLENKSVIALSKAQKQLKVPEHMQEAPKCNSTGEATYRPCHVHHPCAVWTRACSGNYQWLVQLGLELAKEFRHRFKKTHSCEKHIQWLANNMPLTIRMGEREGFAQAMDNQYKISANPIVNYRNYYKMGKTALLKYTNRHTPHFLEKV
jgi:hypothetical protein